MLGRLIDQMFDQHVEEPEEGRIARSFRNSHASLKNYGANSPWGNTLPLLHSADLNILNLETSATTHPTKWPNKVFNYRMHPANIAALRAARISYAGLANNHTLDFSEPGLVETVRTVKVIGITFAGAGETKEEATRPAILHLPASDEQSKHEIHIWAAADHPREWVSVSKFHFIDYTRQTRQRLKDLLTKPTTTEPALRIFSVHWGPNYSWQPSTEVRDLAHFLIDECGIDIIHGHSSHHIQGVERYKGKLIIYGCGDFVDDYALVPEYRNDLSAIWQVIVEESPNDSKPLKLSKLSIYPTKIERFAARLLTQREDGFGWVTRKIEQLSGDLGTTVELEADDKSYATVWLS